jgi:hypothetical protein
LQQLSTAIFARHSANIQHTFARNWLKNAGKTAIFD